MNEQNQENKDEVINSGKEEKKDEEEETIEQANKQIFGDRENVLNEKEENINIVREDNIDNNINNNNDLLETEKKDINQYNNPQINVDSLKRYKDLDIQNNNFNITTNSNINKNRNNNFINRTNYNQHSHIKKIDNLFMNKFENYNDELKRYYFNKQYSNFHISKDENFLERMQFDIYKRQIKEERLNDLVEQNKIRINEEKKIKTFNHLIEDANRRLKAQINMNDLESQLNDDFLSTNKFNKKYNDNEWNEIYKKRFKAYQESLNKKKEENKKVQDEIKRQKEKEIISLCPIKKAPINHILEASQKMYDEARKRKIKKNDNLEASVRISNIAIKNNKNENGEKSKEKNDKNLKNKSNSKDKIILKNKKFIPFKVNIKNKVNYFTPNKYLVNGKSNNKINKSLDKNQTKDLNNHYFDLEEERKILMQMATRKTIPQFNCVNKIKFSEKKKIRNEKSKLNNSINKKNNSFTKDKISESDKMIEEFLMRNIK